MQKASITLPIAASNAGCVAHALLAGVAGWLFGVSVGLAAAGLWCALSGIWLWRARRQAPRGALEVSVDEAGIMGRFLPEPGSSEAASAGLSDAWVPLHCDYLGPWLAGLWLGGKRLWLWPDSAPAEARRRLRCTFHRPGR
ncbi:hypothetical protein GCM10022228_10530 [Halomonas cibimaris]|uniref:Toxin CptA n=1 Tax=Halomonas cibimaris TaxID=657012 RepID=A0ABP7LIE5_9GAMM